MDDLNHPLQFLAIESLDSLGQIHFLLESQLIVDTRHTG